MDLVEMLSNLHALKQLYELLQNIEDNLQHINSTNVPQTLNVRARKLFKHLLDDATKKMLHTHSKIIDPQSVAPKTPCSSQLEQPKAMPVLQSPLSSVTVSPSLNDVPSNEKDSGSTMSTSKKEDQYPASMSSDVPQYKKKRCRACIAKELKKQYSGKEAMSSESIRVPSKNSQDQDQLPDWGSGSVSCVDEHAKRLQESNSKTIEKEKPVGDTPSPLSLTSGTGNQEVGYVPIGELKKKLDEGTDFAKVVTLAIREIESCILALQLSSDLAHSATKNDVDEHGPFKLGIPFSPVQHRKEEAVTGHDMSETHIGESLCEGGTTQLSQNHGKFAESVSGGQGSPLESYTKRYESLSLSGSQNNHKMLGYINRPRVSPSPNKVTMKPLLQLKQTTETSLVQNQKGRKGNSGYNSSMPPSMPSTVSSVRGGVGKRSSQMTRLKTKSRRDQMMIRPVLLDDHKPSQRTRTHKMSYVGSQKKIMPYQQLSEEEYSRSSSMENESSSSVWTSKQNESSASISSSYHRSPSNDDYSMESWSPSNDDFSETESNSQESISSSYHSSEEDRSRLTESVESEYSDRKYPEKSVGRLRKIKNRLGLIFHYHHHHHHHHHDHGNDHSMWKKVQKMFSHKSKHGRNDHGHRKGVKKSLAVKKRSNKNQGGNFQTLVKGMMRHVKHSRKLKGGIRPPQPHGLNKKKGMNKLPWWQPFRRGGVKLPKRGRVKVGFPNKRPKLQMKR